MVKQEFIHVKPRPERPPVESDDAFADHLASLLETRGYTVDPICEDWGWWISVATGRAKMAIGLYSVDHDSPNREFALTVFIDTSKRWVFWPFVSRSIEPELKELQTTLAGLLERSVDLEVLNTTAEFPL